MGWLMGLGYKKTKKKVELMVVHPIRRWTSHLPHRPTDAEQGATALWLSLFQCC